MEVSDHAAICSLQIQSGGLLSHTYLWDLFTPPMSNHYPPSLPLLVKTLAKSMRNPPWNQKQSLGGPKPRTEWMWKTCTPLRRLRQSKTKRPRTTTNPKPCQLWIPPTHGGISIGCGEMAVATQRDCGLIRETRQSLHFSSYGREDRADRTHDAPRRGPTKPASGPSSARRPPLPYVTSDVPATSLHLLATGSVYLLRPPPPTVPAQPGAPVGFWTSDQALPQRQHGPAADEPGTGNHGDGTPLASSSQMDLAGSGRAPDEEDHGGPDDGR
ncbi:unnamed protein product [Lota lota]